MNKWSDFYTLTFVQVKMTFTVDDLHRVPSKSSTNTTQKITQWVSQFNHYKELSTPFFSTPLNTVLFIHRQTRVLKVKNNFSRPRPIIPLLVVTLIDLEHMNTQVIFCNTGNQNLNRRYAQHTTIKWLKFSNKDTGMTSIDFVIMLFLLTLNKYLFVVLQHYSNLLQC